MMLKRAIGVFISLLMVMTMIVGCGTQNSSIPGETTAVKSATDANSDKVDTEKKPFELEVIVNDPEYEAQEKELWEIYASENPNVTIKTMSINEGQEQVLLSRIAAGTPPHITALTNEYLNKNNYKNYANLLNIDYPYWDQLSFDGKKMFEEQVGIKGYAPAIQLFGTFVFTFIYQKDEMEKAGLDPSKVKTWQDIDNLMASLKAYVDKDEKVEYVLDTAWDTKIWFKWFANCIMTSLGEDLQKQRDVFTGKIAWDDMQNNPYVTYFKWLKEYTDKGYLPQKWYTRKWEDDFEAGFISKKSILCFHGPWQWNKTMAADPSAKLDGFPLPANKDGLLSYFPVSSDRGSAIFSAHEGKDYFDEVKKAFIWFNSPEIAELRSQYLGIVCNFKKLSPEFDLAHLQYQKVVKPANEGKFGVGLHWGQEPWGQDIVKKFIVDGKPDVLVDDANVVPLAKYLEGEMPIEDLMKYFKQRWETAYKITD